MPRSVHCPRCDAELTLPEGSEGQVVTCGQCQTPFRTVASTHIKASSAVRRRFSSSPTVAPLPDEDGLERLHGILLQLQGERIAPVAVVLLALIAFAALLWVYLDLWGLVALPIAPGPSVGILFFAAQQQVHLATAAVVLLWVHRAASNLRTLQVAGQKYS